MIIELALDPKKPIEAPCVTHTAYILIQLLIDNWKAEQIEDLIKKLNYKAFVKENIDSDGSQNAITLDSYIVGIAKIAFELGLINKTKTADIFNEAYIPAEPVEDKIRSYKGRGYNYAMCKGSERLHLNRIHLRNKELLDSVIKANRTIVELKHIGLKKMNSVLSNAVKQKAECDEMVKIAHEKFDELQEKVVKHINTPNSKLSLVDPNQTNFNDLLEHPDQMMFDFTETDANANRPAREI